jgi:hypothetical protein
MPFGCALVVPQKAPSSRRFRREAQQPALPAGGATASVPRNRRRARRAAKAKRGRASGAWALGNDVHVLQCWGRCRHRCVGIRDMGREHGRLLTSGSTRLRLVSCLRRSRASSSPPATRPRRSPQGPQRRTSARGSSLRARVVHPRGHLTLAHTHHTRGGQSGDSARRSTSSSAYEPREGRLRVALPILGSAQVSAAQNASRSSSTQSSGGLP